MPMEKERIIAAAYRLSNPNFNPEKKVVYKHISLWEDGVPPFDDIYDIRIGRHHAEILHMFGDELDKHSDGFYTSYGRYVDRYDAAKIALENGQCKEPLLMGNRLDSCDVFPVQ